MAEGLGGGAGAQWAVVDADTDRLLGRVGLREIHLDDGTAEVACWTTAEARGRGRRGPRHDHAGPLGARRHVEGTKHSSALHMDGWHDMHLHARVQGDRAAGGRA